MGIGIGMGAIGIGAPIGIGMGAAGLPAGDAPPCGGAGAGAGAGWLKNCGACCRRASYVPKSHPTIPMSMTGAIQRQSKCNRMEPPKIRVN
jgi:hypothetical protein